MFNGKVERHVKYNYKDIFIAVLHLNIKKKEK